MAHGRLLRARIGRLWEAILNRTIYGPNWFIVSASAISFFISGCQNAAPSNNALSYAQSGRRHEEKGDYKMAIQDFSQSIILAPQEEQGYLDRGMAYVGAGQLDQAIADFTEAIRISPTDAYAYGRRGIAHEDKGALEAALEDYTQTIQLDPNVLHLVERADVRRKLGDVDGAMADLARAIELDPNDDLGYLDRGEVESDKGDLNRAIEDLTRAIELSKDLAGHRSRGELRFRMGDLAGALKDFEQARRASNSHRMFVDIQIYLIKKKLGVPADDGQLASTVRQSKAEWPQPVARFLLGQITEADLLDAAHQGDEKAVRDRSCDAFFYIGSVRLLAADLKGAERNFEQCVQFDLKGSSEWRYAIAELARLKAMKPSTP